MSAFNNNRALADNHRRALRVVIVAVVVAALTYIGVGSLSTAHAARASQTYGRSLSAARVASLEARAQRYGAQARHLIARRNAQSRRMHRVVRSGDAPDPGALSAMRAATTAMASLNGVATPTNGVVFSSTHDLAETILTKDTVMDSLPVFAVVIHGNFIDYQAHTPTGVIPTGSIMTVVFDANTLAITDWSLQQMIPGNLTSLGISTSLGI